MKKENTFYHALKIDDSKCVGCTHCVKKCPTGAVRIKGGKAVINRNWCVDCGECLKSCPVDAIYVEQDDFQNIFNFKNRVVLVPSVFIGQFSKYTTDVLVQVEPQLAFFIADAKSYRDTLELGEILPSEDPYYYAFTVSNFKDDQKANVDLEYQLRIVTTTNLPLQYELYRNTDDYTDGNIIDKKEVSQNSDEMFFQTLSSSAYYDLSFQNNSFIYFFIKVKYNHTLILYDCIL